VPDARDIGVTAADGDPTAAPADGTAGDSQRPGSRTVLYIEDNAGNVRLMERVLSRRPGTHLVIAGTGRDGLNAAVSEHPDLILLDNRLPDATGGDVLRQLGARPATAGIPVIVISGDSGVGAAGDFLANGAVDFLPKPFDIHQLLTTIDRYLP
jgi:CheY-like chemotaxis protein